MTSYRILELEVLRWAESRGILANSDPKTQCLKFLSEAGEVADAVAKGRKEEAEDGIGDVLVTLILLADLLGTDVVRCLELAYEEIKQRQGKMVNGVFVKQSDVGK